MVEKYWGLEVWSLRFLSWFGHQEDVVRPLHVLEPHLVYPHFGVTTGLRREQALQLLCRADAEGLLLGTVATVAGLVQWSVQRI